MDSEKFVISRYSKLIAAIVGLVILQINPTMVANFGVDLTPHTQTAVDLVIMAFTAFSVYEVKNK